MEPPESLTIPPAIPTDTALYAAVGILFIASVIQFIAEAGLKNSPVDQSLPVNAPAPLKNLAMHRDCLLLTRCLLIALLGLCFPFLTSHQTAWLPLLLLCAITWYIVQVTVYRFTSGSLQSSAFNRGLHLWIHKLFSPVVKVAGSLTPGIYQNTAPDVGFELEQALELNYQENTPTPNAHKLLEDIVRFGNTEVWQIMTSRADVQMIPYDYSFQQVLATVKDFSYSRIPVRKHDGIEGLLYIKDLLPELHNDNCRWQELLRPVTFVPRYKKIAELLQEFQQNKIHLAVVLNEYGDYEGVVSLQDIIEEIVGNIADEFDDEALVYSKLDPCNFIFDGKTRMEDFFRAVEADSIGFEPHMKESVTIAGFLLEYCGRILKKNDKVQYGNYLFTIEAADRRRVSRVKVTITQ